jgi:sterol desaturase/sphingolipid hydroxylase (fatty acid hydroxylase superfamily)
MSTSETMVALAGTYLLLFMLERRFPLRRPKAALAPRVFVNAAISAMAFAAAALLVRPSALETLAFARDNAFGIVPSTGLDGAAEVAASFLLMDLTFYYWHQANHRFPLLWRIHNVHHVDPDLDVTTGFRFHFVEVAFSAAFRVVQIALIGPSLFAFMVYEAAFQTFTLFHHSNVRLPRALDRSLTLIVVTPRMHGVHHSDYRDETNSNFGVVFSWWDRLHRTLRLEVPQAAINVGVPAYSAPDDNRLGRCIVMPILPQHDYWRTPKGERVNRDGRARSSAGQ